MICTFVLCIRTLLKFFFTDECTSDCLKNNIKIYVKIAPTYFGADTLSSGRLFSVHAIVTLC